MDKIKKLWRMLTKYGLRYTMSRVREKWRYLRAKLRDSYTPEQLEAQRKVTFDRKIKFSILVPLYNTPDRFLREMIASAQAQTYPDWELCLADGSDDAHAAVGETCRELAAKDPRILYHKLEKNLGISENTNACIEMATGEYIVLFDHDDVLHPAALFEAMHAICEEGADYVYTDEATFVSPNLKKVRSIHYKPDFAPDNLRANNYICHLSIFSREVLERAGRFRREYDGSQDHDMILRLTENAKKVVHIPRVLYYWRSHPQSVAMDISSKTYAIKAGQNAVRDGVRRHGMEATVESTDAFPTIYRVRYALVATPRVSILVSARDADALERCVKSILEKTTYSNYEIVIAGEDVSLAVKDEKIRTVKFDGKSDAKAFNAAARAATGEYLILLRGDTEIMTPEWIEELLMLGQREDVGAVGAKVYYPNDTVAYAGIILGMGREGLVDHAFRGYPRDAIGYMGRLFYAQNLSAVSDACMMVRADRYREMGGMDEQYTLLWSDVDLCLRLRHAGYLVAWTPFAELHTYEAKRPKLSVDAVRADNARLWEHWQEKVRQGDPYFNPNFSHKRNDFSPK